MSSPCTFHPCTFQACTVQSPSTPRKLKSSAWGNILETKPGLQIGGAKLLWESVPHLHFASNRTGTFLHFMTSRFVTLSTCYPELWCSNSTPSVIKMSLETHPASLKAEMITWLSHYSGAKPQNISPKPKNLKRVPIDRTVPPLTCAHGRDGQPRYTAIPSDHIAQPDSDRRYGGEV